MIFPFLHLDITFQRIKSYHLRLAYPRRKGKHKVKHSLSKQGAIGLEKSLLFRGGDILV
jgi:hypothetical protein